MSEPETGWLLIKRGFYWRPNSAGYTGIKEYAGRYSRDEALSRCNEDVTMVHEGNTPNYTEACYLDLKAMTEERIEECLTAPKDEAMLVFYKNELGRTYQRLRTREDELTDLESTIAAQANTIKELRAEIAELRKP